MPKKIHKEDVKAMIRKKGSNMEALGVSHGLGKSSISASFCVPSPTAHKVISAFVGLSVQRIWPEWYDADGNRIYQPRKQSIAKKQSRHCQKSKGELA